MDGVGEALGFLQVRLGGLAPDQVGVRRVGESARDGRVESAVDAVEAFHRALAGEEDAVVGIDVGGQQMRAVGVGARQHQRGNAQHVGRETSCHELLHRFLRRHQHLAAEVAALLGGGQLIFEVHAGRARFDHGLHQLEGVERAAESGFGVGDERNEPAHAVLAFGVMDLVGAHQRVVQAAAQVGHRVRRIEALVGIHLAGVVGVGGDLPAADVDGLQPGGDHLHRLVAGHGAEGVDVLLAGQHLPQALGAEARERVFDVQGAAQTHNIFRGIRTGDPVPAGVGLP